jgi:undecaprenyl-diphosphatase
MNFDYYFFHLLNNLSHKWWLLDWFGVFLAKYLAYAMIIIAILVFFKEKNWRQRIYFFCLSSLSVILSRGIITEAIRFFYHRQRPFIEFKFIPLVNHDVSAAFPSGHAATYFALAFAIFYFIGQTEDNPNPKLGWWCLGMALLMGLGRIFCGVHWPTDIIAGALIGWGSVWLVKKILPLPK